MADLENEVLDWDSEVEDDGSGDFVLLDPGEYPFEVYKLERKFYNGSEKIPPCPMAELTLRVSGPNSLTAMVTDRIYLVKKSEWKISELMRCLGQKQHGEKCKPNWAKVQEPRAWSVWASMSTPAGTASRAPAMTWRGIWIRLTPHPPTAVQERNRGRNNAQTVSAGGHQLRLP